MSDRAREAPDGIVSNRWRALTLINAGRASSDSSVGDDLEAQVPVIAH